MTIQKGAAPGIATRPPGHGCAGTDIVAVNRIAALMRDGGMAFLERWFTAREIDYCTRKSVPSRHFAARLAAKEAVAKVLSMTWDGPLPWLSIEIINDQRGAPLVCLSGAVRDAATRAGTGEIGVSLSHCDEYAIAFVVVREQPGDGREDVIADGGTALAP